MASAEALLDELLAGPISGTRRAQALLLRFLAASDIDQAIRFAEEAAEHAGDDPALRLRAVMAFETLPLERGGLDAYESHVRETLAAAEELGDPMLLATALMRASHLADLRGRPEPALLERAAALAGARRPAEGTSLAETCAGAATAVGGRPRELARAARGRAESGARLGRRGVHRRCTRKARGSRVAGGGLDSCRAVSRGALAARVRRGQPLGRGGRTFAASGLRGVSRARRRGATARARDRRRRTGAPLAVARAAGQVGARIPRALFGRAGRCLRRTGVGTRSNLKVRRTAIPVSWRSSPTHSRRPSAWVGSTRRRRYWRGSRGTRWSAGVGGRRRRSCAVARCCCSPKASLRRRSPRPSRRPPISRPPAFRSTTGERYSWPARRSSAWASAVAREQSSRPRRASSPGSARRSGSLGRRRS